MYFGSVRFFKHLILIVMVLVVVFSVTSCVFMGISYRNMKKALEENGLSVTVPISSDDVARVDPALTEREKHSQYYLSSFEYQKLYPQLTINNDFIFDEDLPKSVYLTFDDGPSSLTPKILDILKERGIHATFFINYNDSAESKELYNRMIAEGHTIGVHSTCHQYATIYQSTGAYLDDFAQTALLLEQSTGVKPEIFRFPGGSINAYNRSVYQQIVAEMSRRGYTYYDWNVSADDATSTSTKENIYNNVVNGVQRHSKSIVLFHDSGNKYDTVAVLPGLLDQLGQMGYGFYPLTKSVRPVSFTYVD